MKQRIMYLEMLLNELMSTNLIALRKNDVRIMPKNWGVYCIRKARSKKTLYIGSSESIYRRIYANLLTKSGRHVLEIKLHRNYGWKYSDIKQYLESCKIQWLVCDRDEALSLEHFAIAVLKPEMND